MDGSSAFPVAHYLQDGTFGLRSPLREDAESVGAWHEGPFPMGPEEARKLLEEHETIPWGNNPVIRLMIVEIASNEVVGGAVVEREDHRVSKLRITAGGLDQRHADQARVAVLHMLVPWVFDELGLMTAVIDLPADDTVMIKAANQLGLVETVRLREHMHRPGGRVDLLMLERVDLQWGERDA